ncbi:MAG: DPP IV N-terminal domain-containing protein [Paludibacteraceae bacterium]|nr:DPP IV N-terminal domain-containing protein [Paludibacteraceae bacterium]
MKRSLLLLFVALMATVVYSAPVLVPMNNHKEYARLSENKQILLKGDYKTGKEDTLVVFSKMRTNPLTSVEAFRFSPAEDKILLKSGNEYYVYRVGTNKSDKLSNNGPQIAPIFSNDGNMVAFIRGNNIFIKRLQFETEVQVTTDGDAGNNNGFHNKKVIQAFGELVSIAWSADNSSLVYIKGQNVYVYNVQYKWHKMVTLPQFTDGYVTHIQWTNSDDKFVVMYLNRLQTELSVALVDVNTLIAKRIYNYKEDKYISPENASYILMFPDANEFGVLEEKYGFNHLHVYSLNNGRYIYQVGKGSYDVTKVYGYNPKTKQIFYQSNGNGPLNRGIYAINIKSGKRTPIAVQEGTNDAFFSKDFKYLELIYSNVNQPHIYSVCNSDGDEIRELHRDIMDETIKKEFFQFTDSLSGWIIRKPGLKNAPVVLNVVDTQNQWKKDISYKLAEQGFVVATVTAHGNMGYGEYFKKSVHGNIFKVPALDYIAAAKGLIKSGIANPKNVFMMGNRMAGGVVLSALMQDKTPFVGGIVISPVTDLVNYNKVEVERYMKQHGATAGYRTNSAVGNAKNIKGKLLIVHSMNDGTNSIDNTNRLIEELVEAGVQFEMQLYPNKDESFTASLLQPHLYNRILNFLKNNIK